MAERVSARLDARLDRDVDRPVGLALSGGGDSLALLEMASAWARGAGRRLLAITIDHGLNSDSADWSRRCRAAADGAGADWVQCRWEGPKPATGLPAAARRARHALIADASREAGALVVLFGHTADDIAESQWMRERGTTLGTLREWSPSPAWPEGRGLMLLRPMLEEGRKELRDFLRARGRDWIEDPGNAAFGRGRARAALNLFPAGGGSSLEERSDPQVERSLLTASHRDPSLVRANPLAGVLGRSSPFSLGEGFEGVDDLGAALLCVAGHDRLPRGNRLGALEARLSSGTPFTTTLAGARIEARRDRVVVMREAGELRRQPPPPLGLTRGKPAVWDGRYEITASSDGWNVVPALERLAKLSQADRAVASRSPTAARGALPVLIRDSATCPVLAWRSARVLSLAPRRLSLALGETTQEKDLTRTVHGETPPSDLF